jgi:nucleoside-diphosphate-sugar epimerase
VILRPGSIYGDGDRLIVPRLVAGIQTGRLKMIGPGDKVLNNTYVVNLGDAIMQALDRPEAIGETFNIRDGRLVTRREYFGAVADHLGKPHPGIIPMGFARAAAPLLEGVGRLRQSKEPPLLTKAAIRFMTANLDFSIAKARRVLGYQPKVDFRDGIRVALERALDRPRAAA